MITAPEVSAHRHHPCIADHALWQRCVALRIPSDFYDVAVHRRF